MKVLHHYIQTQLLRNLLLSLLMLVLLFSIFDFFDRIDNILEEDAELLTVLQYFSFKIPLTVSLMLPAAMLVATMFTIGILSKNSEFTAMRASGLTIFWLCRPILVTSLLLSIFTVIFNETVVPYSTRRVREIYNIDIKQKHKRGNYSQTDYWWRSGDSFYSADFFDSRSNSLLDFSEIEVNEDFRIVKRTMSKEVTWLDPSLGWNMQSITKYKFPFESPVETQKLDALPLPIDKSPEALYKSKTDPHTMSFMELRSFIKEQEANGLTVTSYLADLYAKISFPFVIFIVTLAVIPFSLLPARSGSMAGSFLAGLIIAFSYYVVHSMSIAMGRAEFWPPLLAAWMASLVLGAVGFILNLGAESP